MGRYDVASACKRRSTAVVVLLAVVAGVFPLIAAGSAAPVEAAPGQEAGDEGAPEPTADPVGEAGGPLTGPVAPAESEIVMMRTETSKTFTTATPNMFRKELFSTPVHVKDDQGAWQAIDTDIIRQESGELATETTDSTVTFAETAAEPSVASVDLGDGDRIGFSLAGAADAGVQVEGDTASYDEVLPGTRLELTSLPHGVKEDKDNAQAARPGMPMSRVWGWRGPKSAAVWQQIPICHICQGKYPKSRFPDDVEDAPGGPWTEP